MTNWVGTFNKKNMDWEHLKDARKAPIADN
jgi:hypothetical protein